MVGVARWRPGGQVTQAHGAVERLLVAALCKVTQRERGHGAAEAAGLWSRRLSDERPPPERVRETLPCDTRFLRRIFLGAGGGGAALSANRGAGGALPRACRYRSYLRAVY